MLFYSETTKKTYKTEEECRSAEEALKKKKTERQKDAEVIKELEEKMIAGREAYEKAVSEFIDKYGSYKTTFKANNWYPFFPDNAFSRIFF